MRWIRTHVTSAHVIAMLALFVAMGGTGYAALKLPKNSVGSKQIRKNAVTGSKVKNGSLRAGDFAAGSLPVGPKGDKGDKGDEGDKGSTGATGATGTFGSVTVQYEIAPTGLAVNTSQSYDVLCADGQIAIGGGARGDTTDSEYTIVTSSRPLRTGGGFPVDDQNFNGWRATVLNRGAPTGFPASPPDGPIQPEVWAICATPAG